MVPDFVATILWVIFAYAYPAFKCFKTVEEHPDKTDRLRFWCQYWIIIAVLLTIEKLNGKLLSWLPMYNEAKLIFIIYLWHPQTMGSVVVYERYMRGFVMQYEPIMEHGFTSLRAYTGHFLRSCLDNFTERGTPIFLKLLENILSLAPTITENMKRVSASTLSTSNYVARERRPTRREASESVADEDVIELTSEEIEEDAAVAASLRTAQTVPTRRRQDKQTRSTYNQHN